jgi:hypothetical protein
LEGGSKVRDGSERSSREEAQSTADDQKVRVRGNDRERVRTKSLGQEIETGGSPV